MKNITIAGSIGRDAETRSAGQSTVTGFSVAVDQRDRDSKSTVWFDVSIWGKRGEVLAQYLTKGSKVAVSGEFSTREHNGKTYLQVNASEVSLMGGGDRQRYSAGGQGHTPEPQTGYQSGGGVDDEIPF